MEQDKSRPLPSGSVLQTQLREAPTQARCGGPSPTANQNQNRAPQEPTQAPAGHQQADNACPGPEFTPGPAGGRTGLHLRLTDDSSAPHSLQETPAAEALRPTRQEPGNRQPPRQPSAWPRQDKASAPNDRAGAVGPSLAPGPDFIPPSGPSSQLSRGQSAHRPDTSQPPQAWPFLRQPALGPWTPQ